MTIRYRITYKAGKLDMVIKFELLHDYVGLKASRLGAFDHTSLSLSVNSPGA